MLHMPVYNCEVAEILVTITSDGKWCDCYPIPTTMTEEEIQDLVDVKKELDVNIYRCKHCINNTYLAEDKEDRW